MGNLNHPPYIPSENDTELSKESSRILATYLSPNVHQIKIVEPSGQEHEAIIPSAAYRLLVDVLTGV
jgi:hypothetical protein